MRKILFTRVFLSLSLFLVFLVGLFLAFQFINPNTSKADNSYSSINCPTPEAGKSVLQLVPCTPSGTVTSPSYTTQQQPVVSQNPVIAKPTSAPVPASGGTMAGPVCTPDSTIAKGSSCSCQSDLEADAVCNVSSASVCAANGGVSGGN